MNNAPHSSPLHPISSSSVSDQERWSLGDLLGVWTLLLSWSLWRIPIPAINEPHYWGKARHWWDPAWCAGDLFLESSNPHLVFYASFGSLTRWLDLPTAALVGRILGLIIVAIGWHRLARILIGAKWSGTCSLILFLVLQSIGNFSGEWLVGGMESKVPAYGFLFWGLSEWLRGRFVLAGGLIGLSISFHPLVGIWGGVGVAGSVLLDVWKNRADLPGNHSLVKGVLLCLVLAAPGLAAAVNALSGGTPDQNRIATYLQVADRLSHHLDPMAFPKSSYWYGASLLLIGGLLLRDLPMTPRLRKWCGFVGTCVLVALMGVVIGFGPRPLEEMPAFRFRISLLKFYPFRIGDLIVPVAVSFLAVQAALQSIQNSKHPLKTRRSLQLGLLISLFLAYSIPFVDQNPSRLNKNQKRDWLAAADWIRKETPTDSLVYATDSSWGLRWSAQRPEYINYKDMPQDSASIVEWNNRQWVISRWRKAAFLDGEVSLDELRDLRMQTGIRYLFAGRFGPVRAEPVYQNTNFRVFALPGDDD